MSAVELRLTVTCRVDVKEANFPQELMSVMSGHVLEMLRQCVEPPLRRKPT